MTQSKSQNELIRKLYLCGQIAEHKGEMIREHGDGDEQKVFSALSAGEQEELSAMLTKLQAQWAMDHAQHHKNKI